MTEAKAKPITVTVSQATRAFLSVKAAEGFRSLNREVAKRIEESCAAEIAAAQHAQQPQQKGQQS